MSDIIANKGSISGDISGVGEVSGGTVEKGKALHAGEVARNTGGTNNYENLINQPTINYHTLVGNSDFEDIGLHFMTNTEIKDLLGGN